MVGVEIARAHKEWGNMDNSNSRGVKKCRQLTYTRSGKLGFVVMTRKRSSMMRLSRLCYIGFEVQVAICESGMHVNPEYR